MLMLQKLEIMLLRYLKMNRFIVLDEFGGFLRRFNTKQEAKNFLRNKKGCNLREISLYELLGECLL